MKTFKEYLLEKIAFTDSHIKYWIKPSKTEFMNSLEDSKYHEMRGLIISDGTLYVWDGYYRVHNTMADEIGISGGLYNAYGDSIKLSMFPTTVWIGQWFNRPYPDPKVVKDNKNLQRAYGGSVPLNGIHRDDT